jgi:hypothetical protein
MGNESLIQEVASELSKRFTPDVPAIKKVCCFPLYSLLSENAVLLILP